MDLVVPSAPPGVCFKREKFIVQNFSADVFLQELRNIATLDVLRDDLGAYLKVLRSAMIELINRDYADFVNLSGNLVGLDKAIVDLKEQLTFKYSELQVVAKVVEDAYNKLQFTLSEQQRLREKRIVLESLAKIPALLDHLETLLEHNMSVPWNTDPKSVGDQQTKGCTIERAANEYSRLQHLLVKCNSTSVALGSLQKRSDELNCKLMACLEGALILGIKQQKRDVLQKTLRTFFLLDQCKFAINLICIRLVHPAFASILNEYSLRKDPQDLNGLLYKAKEFIEYQLKDLLDISEKLHGPNEFNLVRDCLWPEFYAALIEHLDCVFAQGNPDLFHKRYTSTNEFIGYLEGLSTGSFQHSLRNDRNYRSLIVRWNLPVYFQMRFQELAGGLEIALIKPFTEVDDQDGTANFHSTEVLLIMLKSCFSPDVYLEPLAHRFWKLSLQMMARYYKKSLEILLEQLKRHEPTSVVPAMTYSSSSSRLVDMEGLTTPVAALSLEQLVMWENDICFILKELPEILNSAEKQLGVLLPGNQRLCMTEAFQASINGFQDLLPKINQLIVGELSLECTIYLKNVSDIPRLYRRTNKETPTRCSGYVTQLLEPIRCFRNRHGVQAEVPTWTRSVLEVLAQQYLLAISDVLTSVQKTEESLKRLRKERVSSASSGVSDNDKIRMQLVIDTDIFVQEAKKLLDDTKPLPDITLLLDIIEPARSIFLRVSPS